jgi:SAM-dependent methyltransferase
MSEFDDYAQKYEDLLRDPIRERFAPGSAFFFERKWELLQDYAHRSGIRLDTVRWLDVGCGKGDLLRIGKSQVAHASGCDVSAEMLGGCKDLDVALQSDPDRLPFDDEQFDLVTAVCVYHHVPPAARHRVTAEIRRVLRPSGIACIIEHNPFNPITQIIVRRTPVDSDAILLTAGSAKALMRRAEIQHDWTVYFLYFPEKLYRPLLRLERMLARFPGGGQYAVFGRK